MACLADLLVSSGKIGDQGLSALAEAAARGTSTLCSLTRLDLASNPISDEGISALVDALRRAPGTLPALSVVELGGGLDDRGVRLLAQLVEEELLGNLQELRFGDNPAASDEARAALALACRT
eukprot:165723-Prymnesium_polylepis.1